MLSGEVTLTEYPVNDVAFSVHTKRDAKDGDPRSMRVDYDVGWHQYKSEWICFEHTGYARQKAEAWWQTRSPDPVPATAEQAVELAQCGALAFTSEITVRSVAGETFERIINYKLGPAPEPVPSPTFSSDENIPF